MNESQSKENYLKSILSNYRKKKTLYKSAIKKARKKSLPNLDSWFLQAHEEVFCAIDCLDCGNCCSSLGPLLRKRDLAKMAKALGLKETNLVKDYLKIDEDGDYIFKEMPCPFLGADIMCLIYPERPDACSRYPYTDQRKMKGRWKTLLKDCETCPAVILILDKVLKRAECL